MATVRDHYQDLLAQHYTWMLGGDIERVAIADRRALEELGVAAPRRHDTAAVDLGCGPGPQTLALADMGFGRVIAVDTSQQLLDELAERARTRPAVRTLNLDLVEAVTADLSPDPLQVAVCMRDTLLHLPDHDTVRLLIDRVASALAPDGTFVLTYRDLTSPLTGTDRFLPVRSDDDQIMLCALDQHDDHDDFVTVTDLVYTRDAGRWTLHKSSYQKLRVAPAWLGQQLTTAGLHLVHHGRAADGMWWTVAHKSG